MKKQNAFPVSRPVSILLLAALAVLIIACSSAAKQGTSSSSNSSSSQTYTSIPIVSTPEPEQPALPGAVSVYVTLQEFTITSSVRTFHAGIHYYFIVTNRGHAVHEFMMMRDTANGTPISFDEDSSTMFIHIEQVFPGTTLHMNFTFTPSLIGKSEIACLMRGHYAAGMHLPIVVAV
ncbi:MAG TPA: hypothetical protein VGT44_11925 [Ktedonobacteraceae bacterium]|nr:hypothetical protein [Ktedonobacteraceae bacterium]